MDSIEGKFSSTITSLKPSEVGKITYVVSELLYELV